MAAKFKKLTDEDLMKAWEKASEEFADFPALRDLHFLRYLEEKWDFSPSQKRLLEPELSEHIRERAKYWMEKMKEKE